MNNFRSTGFFSKIIVLGIFLIGYICPGPAFAESPHSSVYDNINFLWAFGAITGQEDNPQFISITKDTALKTGDQFKMMLELKKSCFIYLLYHGAQGEIQQLTPGCLLSDNPLLYKKTYIPAGDLWFSLDAHTGQETIYLIVSIDRLTGLEALLKDYEASGAAGKADKRDTILQKIKAIKKSKKKLTARAERPVSIGGGVRGIEKQSDPAHDVTTLAVEICARDFYARTFTIEHR